MGREAGLSSKKGRLLVQSSGCCLDLRLGQRLRLSLRMLLGSDDSLSRSLHSIEAEQAPIGSSIEVVHL